MRRPGGARPIVSVDASGALAMPGVLDVIVPDDVRDLPRVSAGHIKDLSLLAVDKVRYFGEPVAVVEGEDADVARAAVDSVAVEYEELPLVLDPEEAMHEDATLVHEGLPGVDGNIAYRQDTEGGNIEATFANAVLVVAQRFTTSKAHAMPMERHAAVASWDPATLWASTQMVHSVRSEIARVFDMPEKHGPG